MKQQQCATSITQNYKMVLSLWPKKQGLHRTPFTEHRTPDRTNRVLEHNICLPEHEHEQAVQCSTVIRASNNTFTFEVDQNIEPNWKFRTQHRTQRGAVTSFTHEANAYQRTKHWINTCEIACVWNVICEHNIERNIWANTTPNRTMCVCPTKQRTTRQTSC